MDVLNNEILISNIQRFSLHDGPGIRTTVFFKGCSLHCPWCANPENIHCSIESYKELSNKANFGYYITLQDLYEKILLDRSYYDSDGGVTFSGGEPLLFVDEMEPLLIKLLEEKISVCIETSLYSSKDNLRKIIPYLNTIIVDVKILNKESVKKYLGGDLSKYYENFDLLTKCNINKIFRMPLIKGFTTEFDNIVKVASFLKSYDIKKIELLLGHNLAEKKYLLLNKQFYRCENLSTNEKETITHVFDSYGIDAVLCNV